MESACKRTRFCSGKYSFFKTNRCLVNELQEEKQIPPVGRNDTFLDVKKGGSIGGEAANASSPSLYR